MKFNTLLDLSKQAKILSGTTASFDGSISLTENLVVSGNTFLTNILLGSLNNRVLSVSEETGRVEAIDFEDRVFYTLEAGDGIDIAINNDKVLISNNGNVPGGTHRVIESFISTSGQTTFSTVAGFVSNYVDVYLNGVRLNTWEYTTLGGHFIILNHPLTVPNQYVDVIIYRPGEIVNPQSTQTDYGLIGDLDGINATFQTSLDYVTGTVKLYLNGIRQYLNEQFIESGEHEITFFVPPLPDDRLVADYFVNEPVDEQSEYGPIGDIDGVNTIFTTTVNFLGGSTKLYLNGIRQYLNEQYTESSSNQITFAVPPLPDDRIIIDYKNTFW